jgi:uncharacterized protein (DUF983 family)
MTTARLSSVRHHVIRKELRPICPNCGPSMIPLKGAPYRNISCSKCGQIYAEYRPAILRAVFGTLPQGTPPVDAELANLLADSDAIFEEEDVKAYPTIIPGVKPGHTNCWRCGRTFTYEKKGSKPQKYCPTCAKIVTRAQTRKRVQRFRERL